MVTKKICFLFADEDRAKVCKLITPIKESIGLGIFDEVEGTRSADVILPFFSPNFIKNAELMKEANRAALKGKKKIMIPIHLSQSDWREWGLVAGRPKFPKEGSLDRVDLKLAAEDLHLIVLQFQVAQYRDWGLQVEIPTYVGEEEVLLKEIYCNSNNDPSVYYLPYAKEGDSYLALVAGEISGYVLAKEAYFLKGSIQLALPDTEEGALFLFRDVCEQSLKDAEDSLKEGQLINLSSLLIDTRELRVSQLRECYSLLASKISEITSRKVPVLDSRGTKL